MLSRVHHETYGLGTVLTERLSESRLPVAVVVFDNAPEIERTILTKFLAPSDAKLPSTAKDVAKRKRAAPKPKVEKIKDSLLVETNDPYLPEDSEVRLELIEE